MCMFMLPWLSANYIVDVFGSEVVGTFFLSNSNHWRLCFESRIARAVDCTDRSFSENCLRITLEAGPQDRNGKGFAEADRSQLPHEP